MNSDEILHVLADESFRALTVEDGEWTIMCEIEDDEETFTASNTDLNSLVADVEAYLIERRCRGLGTPRQKADDLLNLIEQGVPAEEAMEQVSKPR
jgi:hypothetical protein